MWVGADSCWSQLPDAEQAEVRSAMALFHAFAEHQAGDGQGTHDSVQEQARADSATFMRQWQTEAIIMGWLGAAETNAAASIPAEATVAPYGLSVTILAHCSDNLARNSPCYGRLVNRYLLIGYCKC